MTADAAQEKAEQPKKGANESPPLLHELLPRLAAQHSERITQEAGECPWTPGVYEVVAKNARVKRDPIADDEGASYWCWAGIQPGNPSNPPFVLVRNITFAEKTLAPPLPDNPGVAFVNDADTVLRKLRGLKIGETPDQKRPVFTLAKNDIQELSDLEAALGAISPESLAPDADTTTTEGLTQRMQLKMDIETELRQLVLELRLSGPFATLSQEVPELRKLIIDWYTQVRPEIIHRDSRKKRTWLAEIAWFQEGQEAQPGFVEIVQQLYHGELKILEFKGEAVAPPFQRLDTNSMEERRMVNFIIPGQGDKEELVTLWEKPYASKALPSPSPVTAPQAPKTATMERHQDHSTGVLATTVACCCAVCIAGCAGLLGVCGPACESCCSACQNVGPCIQCVCCPCCFLMEFCG